MTAIREIIKPQSSDYVLHIPSEYINKELEVIILPKDEDLSHLSSKIDSGVDSGISDKSHKEIFQGLKEKYV